MNTEKKVNETFEVLGSNNVKDNEKLPEEKTHPYQLRNRDTISKPARYTQETDTSKQITVLKRKRTGKKMLITKKINQINELVQQRSSRTKISYLRDSLNQVYADLIKENEEFMNLNPCIDEENCQEWILEIQFEIDTCNSTVQEYLDSRKDDPPSDTQSISSWAKQCLNNQIFQIGEIEDDGNSKEGFSDLANQMNQLTLEPNATEFKPKETEGVINVGYSNFNNMNQDQDINCMHEKKPPANALVKPDVYKKIPYDTKSSTVIKQNAVSSWDQSLYRESGYYNRDPGKANLQPLFQKGYHQNPPNSPEKRFSHSITATKNSVDSWIDELNPDTTNNSRANQMQYQDIQMSWLMQQSLPRIKIPMFDGSPLDWVEFIIKFKDIVHNQSFISDAQKLTYLHQHLLGEAKRSVQGFANDQRGYVFSLKRLKFIFGQRPRIAQAHLSKVTRGKPISNDDDAGLLEYYYTISDCLVTLKQLNYQSDLYSTDILRQAIRRLPSKFHSKWGEYCLRFGEYNEPNLLNLEKWLNERILASRNPYLPQKQIGKGEKFEHKKQEFKKHERRNVIAATGIQKLSCSLCKEKHRFFKCEKYKKLTPIKKFEFVKGKKLCFNCLKDDHFTGKCTSRNTCFERGCNEKHHTTLHDHFTERKRQKTEKDEKEDKQRKSDKDSKEKHNKDGLKTCATGSSYTPVCLQIVEVKIKSGNGTMISTYALLDNGSQSSLIREDFAKSLNLKGTNVTVNISSIKDKGEEVKVKEFTLVISNHKEEQEFEIQPVFSLSKQLFNMPSQTKLPVNMQKYFNNSNEEITFPSVKSKDIMLLIGANAPELFIQLEVIKGSPGQPMAIRSPLGWTLFGKTTTNIERYEPFAVNVVRINENDNQLDMMVKRFWENEECLINNDREIALSQTDKRCLQKLEEQTKLVDGKYTVPMLWKENANYLPDNQAVATRRYNLLCKRFAKDSTLLRQYKERMQSYIENDYARKMTAEEAASVSQKTWYLPHHPVYHPRKPDKPRVVFDAAATCKGKSLNTSLYTGPDLLNSLVGVLLRFRKNEIALVADIEAMFHQVKVTKADADSLRFLWAENPLKENPEIHQMLVHIFGATDSPTCSNHAVKTTARKNMHKYDPITIESILRSFYVDDFLKSLIDEQKAIKLAKELISIMKEGGFRLTKFLSNSEKVIKALPNSEVAKSTEDFQFADEVNERTLGMCWSLKKDLFHFNSIKKSNVLHTKREVLKKIASVFDPLGFLSPFIVSGKVFLQELWKAKVDWDDTLNLEQQKYWLKWLQGLSMIDQFEIPRCYHVLGYKAVDMELHIFCDASEVAYGAVAYIKFVFKTEENHCTFLMSKTRLAPIKTVSLPRLELNAAVIGVTLYKLIIKEIDLPITKIFFWTDSMLVLQYIHDENHRFKVFVANRVTEIREQTNPEQWNHIEGKNNPADICSRGVMSPVQLLQDNNEGDNWIRGPKMLWQTKENATYHSEKIEPLDEDHKEIKKTNYLVATNVNHDTNKFPFERYSSWKRLKRVMAWIKRFYHNLKAKAKKKSTNLTTDELHEAEMQIIKIVQMEKFADDIMKLKNDQELSKQSKIKELNPFLKDDILRVGGRLKNAHYPYDSMHQIILPKKHIVSELIILNVHNQGHMGTEYVLANVRKKYWIVNGRVTVKKIGRQCLHCRKLTVNNIQPIMSDLPKIRTEDMIPPFSNTGADLFGPVSIKQRRARLKRWGCLFTCLNTRAIHIEVVEGLDTDSFINAFRRFTNRRGMPKYVASDCGTNFKGTVNELNISTKAVDQFAVNEGITWNFNPPASPHMGGIWERIIRTVKRVLYNVIKDTVLTDFQLITTFTEIENILNNRPMTYVSDDINDLEPLTPNHFLLGRYNNDDCFKNTTINDNTCTRKKWIQVQNITQQFWKRWLSEYLPQLTRRTKWQENDRSVAVGDLIILKEEGIPRNKWPLARITEIMTSKDNVTRVVKVKTKDGEYVRPIVKVYPLEGHNK